MYFPTSKTQRTERSVQVVFISCFQITDLIDKQKI